MNTPLRVVLSLVAAAATFPLTACSTNEATGRTQLNFLSRQDEIQLGTQAAPELIASYGGEVPDAGATRYVETVGRRLAEHTEADFPALPWEFTLLNSDVINAFALPGGKVFISRELASRFSNEAELAGVLGHEIGHVTAEHADRMVGTQLGLSVIAAGASILAGDSQSMQLASQAVVTGAGVYALTFSRDQELEADELGMRYMVQAGYDPAGMLRVMEILAAASEGNRQWEILSTHPEPESRIKAIRKRLKNRYASTQGNPEYQLHEARFQREFLDRLRRLPPAPASQASRFDLSAPETWCAHCAARGKLARAD